MLGTTPGALIESSLIENLNPPSALADTSWIHPGMMAWDHWWSGDTLVNNDTIKRYIAFASEMGFPYQLMDWPWYGPYGEPTTDIMKPKPDLDWQGLLAVCQGSSCARVALDSQHRYQQGAGGGQAGCDICAL